MTSAAPRENRRAPDIQAKLLEAARAAGTQGQGKGGAVKEERAVKVGEEEEEEEEVDVSGVHLSSLERRLSLLLGQPLVVRLVDGRVYRGSCEVLDRQHLILQDALQLLPAKGQETTAFDADVDLQGSEPPLTSHPTGPSHSRGLPYTRSRTADSSSPLTLFPCAVCVSPLCVSGAAGGLSADLLPARHAAAPAGREQPRGGDAEGRRGGGRRDRGRPSHRRDASSHSSTGHHSIPAAPHSGRYRG
jgi:hypothetical protein